MTPAAWRQPLRLTSIPSHSQIRRCIERLDDDGEWRLGTICSCTCQQHTCWADSRRQRLSAHEDHDHLCHQRPKRIDWHLFNSLALTGRSAQPRLCARARCGVCLHADSCVLTMHVAAGALSFHPWNFPHLKSLHRLTTGRVFFIFIFFVFYWD